VPPLFSYKGVWNVQDVVFAWSNRKMVHSVRTSKGWAISQNRSKNLPPVIQAVSLRWIYKFTAGRSALVLVFRSSPLLNRTGLPSSFLLSLLSWDRDLVAEMKSACSQQEKPWWMDSFASRKNGRGICVTGNSRGTCNAIRDLLMLPPLHQTMASSLIATERNSYSQKIISSEKLSQPSWRWPQWSTTRVLGKRGEIRDRKSFMEASWARKQVDAQLTVDAGDDDRKLQLEANTYHQRPSAHQIQEWLIRAFRQRTAIVQNDAHSRQRRLVLGCRAGRPTTDWKMHALGLLKPEAVWENHRCFRNPAKESRPHKGITVGERC